MQVNSYQDLNVWKEGMRLTLSVYDLTSRFPDHERFGLVSQIRRCSVSIPSNIAEGHARLSTREYVRHLSIALGSLAELETQLHLAKALNYGEFELFAELFLKSSQIGKQLRSLVKSLRSKIGKGK
jgi:four helix bundle protein